MKSKTVRHLFTFGSVSALLLSLAASQLHAGPRGGRGGRPPGPVQPALNLTDAQKKALEDAHTAIAEKSKPLRTDLETARAALHDAVLAETPNADTIRAAAKKMGEIEGELAVIRATELAKIRPLFTAEQWAALQDRHILHHLFLHYTEDDADSAQ